MPDTYGVEPADIATELPALYPSGEFTVATKPTYAQVASMITVADTVVTLRVIQTTGVEPTADDRAADIARRYIIERVKAQVLRIVYTGNDPVSVNAAVGPYDQSASEALKAIEQLGLQAVDTGDAAPRVLTPDTSAAATREMIITADDLDAGSNRRRIF